MYVLQNCSWEFPAFPTGDSSQTLPVAPPLSGDTVSWVIRGPTPDWRPNQGSSVESNTGVRQETQILTTQCGRMYMQASAGFTYLDLGD